jgi:hypothetical protein
MEAMMAYERSLLAEIRSALDRLSSRRPACAGCVTDHAGPLGHDMSCDVKYALDLLDVYARMAEADEDVVVRHGRTKRSRTRLRAEQRQ